MLPLLCLDHILHPWSRLMLSKVIFVVVKKNTHKFRFHVMVIWVIGHKKEMEKNIKLKRNN